MKENDDEEMSRSDHGGGDADLRRPGSRRGSRQAAGANLHPDTIGRPALLDQLRLKTPWRGAEKYDRKGRAGLLAANAPLGHRNATRDDGRKIIVLDQEAAPIIRKMFECMCGAIYRRRR
jgi:hypothetical protein